MYLSKTKYSRGMLCPKILWLDRNMPEQKAEQDDTRMLIGNMVGDLAMGYFGDYTEVPFNRKNMRGMLNETRRLINIGIEVIAEASFTYNGNFCSVDILRKVDGGCEIIEVKSTSGTAYTTPENIKNTYGPDLAYQYYVLTNCGLNVTKVNLMQLNKKYIRHGELDLQRLFVMTDCTDLVLASQDVIEKNIAAIKSIAALKGEPEMQIRSGCKNCAYGGWCLRDLPENNVFDIGWGMRGDKKNKIYQRGLVSFQDVLDSTAGLSEKQLLQVETVVNNLPPHIEPHSIRQFLNGLTYPLYHLDFETYQQVVPLWDGVKPYQQIPFQYSLHIQNTPGAEPTHKEFLGKEGADPRRELAERLCTDIPQHACVMAYNKSFEQTCMKALAQLYPDLAEHLIDIGDNMIDLMEPFQRGYYYRREMGRGYSIKVVLPALCGDDPALDHHALELIHDGTEAMKTFANLHEKSPAEIAETRAALLAYCKLDTLAMVKILEKLYGAAGEVM